MKNFKKFIATILATTLTMGCMSCMDTFGTDDYFGDGTMTYHPDLNMCARGRRLQALRSRPRFCNILNSHNKEMGVESKKISLIVSFNYFLTYFQERGLFIAPPDNINFDFLKETAREIIKKCLFADVPTERAPFATDDFLSILEDTFAEDAYKIILCKIIHDFVKSEQLSEEVKENIKASCPLLAEEETLNKIIAYIDYLEEI